MGVLVESDGSMEVAEDGGSDGRGEVVEWCFCVGGLVPVGVLCFLLEAEVVTDGIAGVCRDEGSGASYLADL